MLLSALFQQLLHSLLDPSSVWRGGTYYLGNRWFPIPPWLAPRRGHSSCLRAWWQPGGITMVVMTDGGLRDPGSTFQLNQMKQHITQIIMCYLNFRHIKRCQVTGEESVRLLSVDCFCLSCRLISVKFNWFDVVLWWLSSLNFSRAVLFHLTYTQLVCCCQCCCISNIDDSSMLVVEKMSPMDESMDMTIIAQWNNMTYKIPSWKYFCFMEQQMKSWMSLAVELLWVHFRSWSGPVRAEENTKSTAD